MEFASAQIHQKGNNLYVTHGEDSNLWVEFRKEPVKNEMKSESEGRAIFDDVVFIDITFPGDKTKKVVRPVQDSDKERFARQWENFQKGETGDNLTGTRLEEWPLLSRSEIAELKAINIFTVDQLANLPDSALNWLGARTYRTKAEAWLKTAKDTSVAVKLAHENEVLKGDIEQLKQQIKDLSEQITKPKRTKQSEES